MARLAGVQKAYYSPGAGPGFEAGHIGECLAPLAGRGTSEGPARQGLTRGIPLRGGGLVYRSLPPGAYRPGDRF